MIETKWYSILIVLFMLLAILFGGFTQFSVQAINGAYEMEPIDGITTGEWDTECGQVGCCEVDFGGVKTNGEDGTFYYDGIPRG